jgi:hypothetical protein
MNASTKKVALIVGLVFAIIFVSVGSYLISDSGKSTDVEVTDASLLQTADSTAAPADLVPAPVIPATSVDVDTEKVDTEKVDTEKVVTEKESEKKENTLVDPKTLANQQYWISYIITYPYYAFTAYCYEFVKFWGFMN